MLAIEPAEAMRLLSEPTVDLEAREKSASPAIKKLLETLRLRIKSQGAEFTVGYSPALDVPIKMLAGTMVPREPNIAPQVNQRGEVLRSLDIKSAKESQVSTTPSPSPQACEQLSHFDWRQQSKVTKIRTQICGCCWDFAAMAAYEGSYALRNNRLIDTSEQYILNCATAGSCDGGWWMPVFDFLMSRGDAEDTADPFTGNDQQPCPQGVNTPYRASAWGFVSNNQWTIPSVQAIKKALCNHGPLVTAVFVDPAFQAYSGGVFDEHHETFDGINHGVVIIGWDDPKKAWLIKNSWGPAWGDTCGFGSSKGFMWIAYNSNNIGTATAWVDAKNDSYKLVPEWEQDLQQLKVTPPPLLGR